MGDYTCVTILEMEDATVAVGTRVSWRRLPDCRCTTLSGPIAVTTEPSKPEIGIEVHTTNASALREAGFRGAPKDWGWEQDPFHRCCSITGEPPRRESGVESASPGTTCYSRARTRALAANSRSARESGRRLGLQCRILLWIQVGLVLGIRVDSVWRDGPAAHETPPRLDNVLGDLESHPDHGSRPACRLHAHGEPGRDRRALLDRIG